MQQLTADFAAVKAFIDTIDSSGGTDIGVAVRSALDELDRGATSSRARVIVLLTDGDGRLTDNSLTSRAANSDTIIYTVGLGAGVQDALLQGIADGTGGKYFKITTAEQLGDVYDDIAGDIGSRDADEDGISDKAETEGWRTQRGIVYRTDPNNRDSDGDGLIDGDEAGPVSTSPWGEAYAGLSNPNTAQTDSDGLDDLSEFQLDTALRDPDTDDDGLNDKAENDFGSDPTDRNIDGDTYDDAAEFAKNLHLMDYDLASGEGTGALMAGFVFGDWDWGAKNVGRQNDAQMQSFQYIGGQFASGVAVVGDIRDFIANLGQGDITGALLSAAGLIPAVGDGAKFVATLVKFVKRGKNAEKAAYRRCFGCVWSMAITTSAW